MAQPEHHAGVDVARRADAFAERERGLVDHLADDSPEHQAGRVADPRHVLAERGEEPLGARRRQRRGALAARQLDQRASAQRRRARESRPRCRRGRARSASRARTARGARLPAAGAWPLRGGPGGPSRSRARAVAGPGGRSRRSAQGNTPPRRVVRRAHFIAGRPGRLAQFVGERAGAGDHHHALAGGLARRQGGSGSSSR